MGLREQKRRATHERMVDAARRLFDEHGYDETTVEMIANSAGVSGRTFHRYFATKDGVVAEGGNRIVDRAIDLLPARATVADIVRCLAGATEEGVDDGGLEWSVKLRRENPTLRASTPAWMHRWAERVADALAAAEERAEPSFRHRLKAFAGVHASAVAADEWIREQPDRRLSDLADEAMAILVRDLQAGV